MPPYPSREYDDFFKKHMAAGSEIRSFCGDKYVMLNFRWKV
jgi:hypothetical protein